MSAEKIHEALELLRDNPEHDHAWAIIEEAVTDPGDRRQELVRALEEARMQHERFRDWSAVARLLELEIALVEDPNVASPKQAELGRVCHEELLESERAIAAYQQALELRPEHAETVEALSQIQAAEAKWSETVERCLVEALGGDDPVVRSQMLTTVAETTYRFGGSSEAVLGKADEYVSHALELDATNRRAVDVAAVIYRRVGAADKLAEVLGRKVDEAPTKAERAAAARHLAHVALVALRDRDRAIEAFQMLLDLSPGQLQAQAFLVQHYTDTEQWEHLVSLYQDQLAAGGLKGSDEFGVLIQVAMLYWKTLDRPAAAEPYFERVRRIEPAHEGMLAFFRERCGEDEKARLMSVLTDASRALEDGPKRLAVLEEIAALAEGQENSRRAIEQYKAILRSDPDSQEARDALKRLYLESESYNALVELHRQDLQRRPEDDVEGRAAVLREIAAIYRDHIQSDTSLLTVLNQILQLDSEDIDAVRSLARVYESLGRWRDLLNMQQRLAELTDGEDEKVELLRAVAKRWLEQFSNVQNAISAYEALLEVLPKDLEAREQLRELYQKRRAWPKLYELYEVQLDELEGAERVALMMEMAKLAAERLDRGADAIRLLKDVLEIDASAEGVLDTLERQAERQKDFATVAEVLGRRIDEATDDKAKLALLQKLGVLYSDRLDDTEASNRAWRRVLELSPGHKRALRVLRQAYVAAADWDGLEELYSSQNDWEGLADCLSSTADRIDEPAPKIELSFRVAGIYEQRIEEPERAVRAYERILSVDRDNVKAATALLPLYEAEEKWSRLPGLYAVLLDAAEEVDDKIDILRQVAGVTGGPLANKSAALGYARQAYELRPDEESLEVVAEWSRQAGEWSAFIEAVRSQLERAEEIGPARVRKLQLMLARVYAQEVERTEDAVEIYRRLVEADPSDSETTAELEALLRAADRRDDLRWLFGVKCEQRSGAEQCEALEEWAGVEENVFGEPERAIELLERVIAVDPARTTALESLGRLQVAAEQYAAAAQTMMAHRDAVEGPERAALDVALATLQLERLDEPTAAFDACLQALAVSEGFAPAVELLERLLEQPETRTAAAETLERIYASTGQAAQQVDVLRVLLEQHAEAELRLELCRRLADVYEHGLEQIEAAFEVVLNTLLEFPGELALWDRAAELAGASGQPTDLAEAYRKHLSAEAESAEAIGEDLRIELCQRAAALHEDLLGDAEGAIPYLEGVLSVEPGNERAFERLKQILDVSERWAELEELYRRAVAATDDPSAQVELLAEVALVAEERIGEADKAIGYYERILALDPLQEGALHALEQLYGREERHAELAALLEQRLETATDAEAVPIRLELVELNLRHLDAPERVMTHLESALAVDADNAKARELAEQCLEVPSLRQQAAALLDHAYEARDEVEDLVRVLDVRLEGASDEHDQRELLHRISELRLERLEDDAGAFASLRVLVPLEPEDTAIRERFVEIGHRLGEHLPVAEALLEAAEACAVPAVRGEILMAAAGLYRDMAEQLDRAEQVYRQVLEIDPDDPELVTPAAEALAQIYAEQSEHAKLAEALEVQVRLVQDPPEHAELCERIAELYENVLGDDPKAIEAWKMRLSDDRSDETSLRSLERLYERTEQWSALVAVLRQLEQAAVDGDERRRTMVKAAEVLAERLEDTTEAIHAWRAVLDDFGSEIDTLSAIAKLYQKAERWDDLADVLEMWLSLADDLGERVELYTWLGDVRRLYQNDPSAALGAYREVLLLEPGHKAGRSALDALLEDPNPDIKREAAEILRPLYEADDDSERLLKVLDIEVDSTFDPAAKLDTLRVALRTAEDVVGDSSRAFDYACRGVREALGEPTVSDWIETVERLAGETERWADLMDLFESVVDEMLDADVQRRTRMRAGELGRSVLEDPPRAIRHFKRALEDRPDDRQAMLALEELYEATDDAPALLEILQLRAAEAYDDDEERVSLLFRIAELQAGPLEQPEAAIDTYEELIDVSLEDRAIETLDELYRQAERYSSLVELYQRQLDADEGERAAAIHVKIARVAHEHLDDTAQALDELGEAMNIEPTNAAAVEVLEQLLEQAEDPEHRAGVARMLEPVYRGAADWSKMRLVLETALETTPDPDERVELLRRLATLFEEQLEDYSAALDTMAKLLKEDPGDESIWAELERLARVLGDDERLAKIYAEALSDVMADDPRTAELSRRTGELYAAAEAAEEALRWYRRAQDFSPDSEELFEAIDGLLVKLERPAERVDHYRAALDHTYDDERRVGYLHTIAELQQRELEQTDEAIATLCQVLDIAEQDERALGALTGLYQATERRAELADLYQRRADLADDPEQGAPHRLALARLLAEKPEDRERAIDQLDIIVSDLPWHEEATSELEKLLGDEDGKPRVLEILRPLYERADNWQGLIRLNEEQLGLVDDPGEKVATLNETASLWEVNGEDPEQAFAVMCQAFELLPDDTMTRQALERLAETLAAWPRLADSYEAASEAVDEEYVKRELLERLATISDRRLDDPRRALGALGKLAELEPVEPEVLDRMDQLCMLLGDWATLVTVLDKKAEAAVGDEDTAGLLRRVGALRHEMLEDEAGAIRTYERALELEPHATATIDRLLELYDAGGQTERLVELIEQRIELADEDDELRFGLLLRAAELCERELEQPAEAIRMLSMAADLQPSAPEVLAALERLFLAEGRYEELLDNLKVQASIAEDPAIRVALRNKIGDLHIEQFDNTIDALEQYRLVLDETNDDDHAITAVHLIGMEHEDLRLDVAALLEPVLSAAGRFDQLVEVMELRLQAQIDPGERADTLGGMALIHEEQRDEPEAARDCLLRALKETPAEAALHDDIVRLSELTEDYRPYAEALEAQAAAEFDAEVAADLFIRLGRMAEDKLDDAPRAIEAYRRAVDHAGEAPELLEALDRLYQRTDDAQAQAGIIGRRVDAETDDELRADLYFRLARLQIEAFDDKAQGLATLRQVMELVGSHEQARQQLEALTDVEELFEETAEILEKMYRAAGDNAALARLYEKRIGYAPTAADRIRMRLDLAQVLEERAFDSEAAQRVVEKAFADDASEPRILSELSRLAQLNAETSGEGEPWRQAAEAVVGAVAQAQSAELEGTVEGIVTPEVARDLYLKAAGWYQAEVGDAAEAERCYRRALEQDGHSVDALEALKELYRAAERHQELVQILRQLANLGESGEAQIGDEPATLRREAKTLAETELEDVELTEQILREMLSADDGDPWALAELCRVREQAEDFEEVYRLLTRQIEIAVDADELRELRHQAAEVAADKLGEAEDALGLYEQAFEDDSSDETAAGALRELYLKLERHEDLLRLTVRLIDLADEPAERAELRLRAARICIETLETPTEGIDHLHAVLEEVPDHEGAVVLLSDLLEKEERDSELAELLNTQIQLAVDKEDEQAELGFRVRLAELYETRLNEPDKAIEGYRSVLERNAGFRPALEALARLYEQEGQSVEAAATLEKLLEDAEGEQAVRLALKSAELYASVPDEEAACRALEGVLEKQPEVEQVRDELRRLYRSRGAWDKLAELIAEEANAAEDEANKVALYRQAAEIQASECQDHAAAADLLERALELQPEDRDLMLSLCDEYTTSGRGGAAIEVLRRVVESYGGRRSKELGDIYFRIASAYLADGDDDAALKELELARKMDPGSIPTLHALGELSIRMADASEDAEREEHLKRAGNNFRSLLLQRLGESSPLSKAEVFCYLAEVHHRQGDDKKAIQMLERALASDKGLERAKELLDELKG